MPFFRLCVRVSLLSSKTDILPSLIGAAARFHIEDFSLPMKMAEYGKVCMMWSGINIEFIALTSQTLFQFEILQAKRETISLRKRINVSCYSKMSTTKRTKSSLCATPNSAHTHNQWNKVHLKVNPLEWKKNLHFLMCLFFVFSYRNFT